ncbi:hypothetical protein F4780DRAFT_70372 [Xylariomycetidae sp. FL0641]|nr:hypothetical protein F4780DRAFT_70372 [Xylariomycetidae sp. FL0641]
MSSSNPDRRPTEAASIVPSPKRRKVRKGTQSCWECKRRKTRCTFTATTTKSVCDGCRSRQTKCISQEFPDEATQEGRNGNRLRRIESLVEKLQGQLDASSQPCQGESAQENSGGLRTSDGDRITAPVPAKPALVSLPALDAQVTGNFDDIQRALIAAWPNQAELDLIIESPVTDGVYVLLHGVVCLPYSKLPPPNNVSMREVLQLPPEGSHPVIMARKLLLLGILLQSIQTGYAKELASRELDCRATMSRVVSTASRLVTSNDELVSSLDGVECVMIESMLLNNAGLLRDAWLVNRRAMLIGQLLGLHQHSNSPGKFVDAHTRQCVDPNYMWFRIVHTDRYLSLMTGLPQGCLESVFASPKALEACMPLEQLERIESAATGLILQRNNTQRTDLAATRKIDKMLMDAASLMPPQWWSTPHSPTAFNGGDATHFEESIRIVNHFTHYMNLIQLHSPYLMQSSSAHPEYEYSKMSATNASRVLVRSFVNFRSPNPAIAYCRGMDFGAFIASTTLCLAHIESRRQPRPGVAQGVTAFHSLRHERLQDRGLLERTLEIMEGIIRGHNDPIARRVSGILRPLLVIENDSAMGGCYQACASPDSGTQDGHGPRASGEPSSVLSIQIPYLGGVRIEHSSRAVYSATAASGPQDTHAALPIPLEIPSTAPSHDHSSTAAGIATPTVTGAELASGNADPAGSSWLGPASYIQSSTHPLLGRSADETPCPANLATETSDSDEAQWAMPNVDGLFDDWTLQGVDTAFFNNFTRF